MLMRLKLLPLSAAIMLAALLTPVFSVVSVRAAPDTAAFVENLTYTAFATLGNHNITEQERFAKFSDLLHSRVDMPRIGRFVLGANWRQASPEQQAEYQKLFSDYVVSAFAGRLQEYTDSQITIKSSTPTGKGEHIVSTLIRNPKNPEPVKVDWRLRENAGALQVLDMTIEGVSMALTQRSEFSSLIQQNGGNINALLDRLRSTAEAVRQGKQVSIGN
ncbi:MAG: phospholipid transport system substrate-binding protein [Alphaproteobacteria bacterium]|nr:phospholipid transport system substrate-binding protein [Alphaproteobacteria bacterium]